MMRDRLVLTAVIVLMAALFSASARAETDDTKVLIVYYSFTGSTEKMAMAVAAGVRRVDGVEAAVRRVDEVTREDLQTAGGIVLGSPTYYANMAGPMKKFIDDWAFKYGVLLFDKVGGAFATGEARTGGKEHVVSSLLRAMMMNGMIIVGPHYERWGTFGTSALTASSEAGIDENELEDARLLGERVATVTRRLTAGQAAGASSGH